MIRYILNRVLSALLTMFVLATATFFLLRLVPGDPFAGPKVTPEVKERLRIHYGLDKPLPEQYVIYMGNLLRGDFGYSLAKRGHHVNTIIKDAFPQSLDLGIRAMISAIVFGIFFGIVAALYRGKPLDYFTVILVLVGISVPSFVVAGLLQFFFGVYLKILPVARYESFRHTLMPAFALSLGTMATLARYMRASMLEIVNADYIKTAKAKGLRKYQIVIRHQIRNALFPILTILGPAIAMVLTGSFIIESIFAIPGLGRHYVLAMQNLDYTLVMGLTLFFGFFLIAMNLLVDFAYGIIDPRVRHTKK
ncbi:binding-protein-dependent transport systems inner membrane component [Candidatus Vecturithrix granuli]|uniref:Binding-protein-dependent transport systems inner membrane component n=1 Tax=Vecturithrix granuli TaxID=1499967 RepID=A0A0S6WC66_VECG1|nr:binding-protein-dependent transport systems inner membrane component [Candidatus Vecturithrix granuli]